MIATHTLERSGESAELMPSLRLAHPNTLLVGPRIHTERALAEIRPTLRAPLASWSPTETPHLPEIPFRTLIVRDVDCLTARQQASLAALASRSAGEIQIVSTASLPVFPLVKEGRFLDALYYQLNVVLLEFSSGRTRRA